MNRIITASYSSGCFCDKPVLPKGDIIENNKTFKFKAAADRYCASNGLTPVGYSQYDKVMTAVMNHKCNHRDEQTVRIEWNIQY